MFRRFAALAVLVLPLLVACGDGDGIPNTNVVDYHVTFTGAQASSSCPQPLHDEATVASQEENQFTETYRIHFVEGPDEPRVDYYWKERGSSDSSYVFFAAGILQGTLDQGNLDYAGGSFDETRGSDQLTYRIEGRSGSRFSDELVNGSEDYIIENSSNTADYPIGCVYTVYYSGNLASGTDDDS
ncbi:MAG: hypothetical protein VX498_05110 [Myxococcota bacterium]|nr:hypothetical protein [Myxococcota bacterium]